MSKFTKSLASTFIALTMMSLTSLAQLSGTYTIDPNGTGTSNYASFTAATAALTTSGVSGAVTFNVKEGTYTEQVSFGAYTGASAANKITFKSDATNTSPAVITFAPTSSAVTSNYTVQFNNAAYITMEGLTVATTGTTYGRLVNITGTTNNVINVDNCTFNGYVGSTSSFFALWYASAMSYDSLTIENSTFNDGSYGVYLYGSSSAMSENLVFRNNTLSGFNYAYGLVAGYTNSGAIHNNTIHQATASTGYAYGIRLYGSSQNTTPGVWTVHDNDIKLNYGYGIYAYYTYGTATEPTTIYNNAVVFNSGSLYNYGLYVYHPVYMEVTNNTFRTASAYAQNKPVYTSASTSATYPTPSITLKNNIFHNEVQGYPVYFYVSASLPGGNYVTSENNLFYTPSTGVTGYYYGTASLASFAAYQAASGDSTSTEGDAQFTNAGDWHVEGLAASNNAQSVSYITVDLDGDARSSTAPDIGADEFTPPACATPSSLTFGSIYPTSASVSWIGASSAFELEWGLTGFTQGTGTATTATSTSATLSGLASSTTYDVYIRANCVASGNGYSGWYGPVSFTTPCLPYSVTPTTGYIENFDGSNWTALTSGYTGDVFDNCWDRTPSVYSSFAFLVRTGSTPSSSTGPLAAHSGSNYLYTEGSYGSAGVSAMVKTQALDLGAVTNPELSFYYHMYGASITGLWVDVSTDNGATFTAIDSLVGPQQTSNGAPWTQHITNLSAYAGDTIVVALRTVKGISYTNDLAIDNLSIQDVLCSGPSFLTASGVNTFGAILNWSVPDTANPTVIAWGPSGFTPGTGSTVTTYDSTYTLNTLASATCYDVYVQSLCGANGSPWMGPVSFCTPCNPATMPYTEDFQNWSATSPLACWDIDNGTNNAGLYTNVTNGNKMIHYDYWSWQSGLTAIAESRPVTIQSAATVSFDWSHSNQYYTNYNDALALRVRKSTSSNWDTLVYLNGQSFGSPGATISAPGAFVNSSVYLDTSYVGHDAIFEFYGASGWGPDLFIDNFAVDYIPQCPDPVLTSTGETASSVTLAWSTVGTTALGSSITWGPQGFYTGTGATSGTVVSAVTSPHTISGLSANTYYDFYVQDSCGGAGNSAIVGPVTVKTSCLITLSGTYSIDSAGTGGNNFASIDSAAQFLGACGISGPVIFNVAAGNYTGSIDIGQITGASSTNTVTFNGPSTGTATITAQTGSSSVVTLDGSEYVTINGLTLVSPVGQGIILTGGAQYITLDNNVIIADTVGSGLSGAITVTNSLTSPTAYGLNAEHVTITNNHVKGGYFGIVINGQSTTSKVSDFVINGNTLTKQYFYGIRTYYTENVEIIGNSVTDNRASGGYGVMCYYTNDFVIEGNFLPAKSYGLYLYYPNVYDNSGMGYIPTSQSRVANNMVTGNSYGAYIYSPRFIDFHNNSFRGNTYGIYMSQTTAVGGESRDLDMRNNIFVGGANYAFYTFGAVPPNMTLDYNVYNAGGTNIAYFYGTAQTTLAAWQAADTAYNANSNDGPVNFMANDDLHLITGANNIGTSIATITVDIDGDTRSTTTPDIGADEYSPINTDALNDNLIGGSGGCGDSTTMLYTVFQNFGLDTITSLPVELLITDAFSVVTTLNATYTGSVLPMAYDTLLMGSINTYAGGTYDFKSYTQLTNDGRGNNDTLMMMGSSFLPSEPVVSGLVDTVCASQDSILLTAINVPGTTYGWYASDTSSAILTMGDSLTVATAGQSKYYVGYLNTADSLVGPIPGGNGSAGNMFNIINTAGAPLSITGFSQGPGSGGASATGVTVQVYSSPGDYTTQSAASWTQAGTAVTNLTSGASTGYCPVAVTIPAGATYGFYVGVTTGSVQYTNGTGTPGVSTWFSNNDMIVTQGLGGGYPSPTFSPRNWNGTVHYGAAGCSNIRAEVEFALNSDTALAVGAGVETDPLTGTFDFDATGSYGNVYVWYFGDSLGMMGSGMMTQHVYGAAGIYTVGLVVLDTICGTSDSTSFQVTCTVSMDENGLDQSVRAFPNPSNGQVAIHITGANSFKGSLEVINGVGKVLVKEAVSKQEGRFELPLDLRELPKGVYTIRLSGESGQTNLRVVLQ